MRRLASTDGAALRAVGIAVAAAVVLIVVLAVVSHLGGDDSPARGSEASAGPVVTEPPSTGEPSVPADVSTDPPGQKTNASKLPPLPTTTSPDEYAVAVAEVVLGLNARDHSRQDYIDLLLGEITDEAVGNDRDRIEPTTVAWIPDEYLWSRQHTAAQVNRFAAEHVWVPEQVVEIEDEIPPGYQVRTVAGTQTAWFRDEAGDMATTETPRLVTVVMYCPRSARCSLVAVAKEVLR